MNRLGLLRAALPASVLGFVIAACGGTDGNDLGLGGGDDAGGGGDAIASGDGGGSDGTTGEGGGGGDGGATDGGGGDGAANDAGVAQYTYVSGIRGVDTNPGTQALPVKTITKGIQIATALGGAQSVFVGQGHYPEKVTMVEGVSLLGGHQCDANSCTWTRDRVAYDTAIDMQDAEGVLAGATITKKTKIDGFRLRGKPGAANGGTVACITLDGGSPTMTFNVVAPGDVTGARAVGIEVYAPTADQTGALIDNNLIQGGTSTVSWIGIAFEAKVNPPSSPSVAMVTNNKIRGGAAPFTSGVNAFSCGGTTTFFKNDILAGTSNSASSANNAAWAIQAFGKATYDSNLINVDQANVGTCQGAALCGGFISYSSTSTLTNNIIFGVKGPRTTGVLLSEAEVAAGVVVMNGNYLDGAGVGLGSNQTISSALQLRNCGGGNCGVNTIIGKARNNILMGGNNQLRYGVYEEQLQGRTVHPSAFEYTDIFFSAQSGRTDVLYHFWNGAIATDLTTLVLIATTVPSNPAPNNLYNVDPLLDATMHLKTNPLSPMIDKGTATEAPPKDFEGDTRPKGAAVDIGHDEAQ